MATIEQTEAEAAAERERRTARLMEKGEQLANACTVGMMALGEIAMGVEQPHHRAATALGEMRAIVKRGTV